MYPNPANNSFFVKIYYDGEGDYALSVRDLFGKEVINDKYKGSDLPEFEVNTNDLKNGIYFLVVSIMDNKLKGTYRVVILK